MSVLLITGAGNCGIAEHGAYLAEGVRAAGVEIDVASEDALDPDSYEAKALRHDGQYAVAHLNYHAALHSRWTPARVEELKRSLPVVITYHDTGVPNSDQCKALHAVADAFVVHEPCEDLTGAIYWRQGVPARQAPWTFEQMRWPVVGSVGFPFAWKNFDLLAEASHRAGWSLLLLAPTATAEQVAQWTSVNPFAEIIDEYLPASSVVSRLAGCDATAFLYNTHNTGTSGAIRQGIAARKPLIASKFPAGRQFRDLEFDPLGARAITWIEPNLENVVAALSQVRIAPIDAGMVALAERDSWANVGKKYAALYQELGHV